MTLLEIIPLIQFSAYYNDWNKRTIQDQFAPERQELGDSTDDASIGTNTSAFLTMLY